MSAGQEIGSPIRENRTLLPAPLPPDEAPGTLAAAAGVSTVGLRPPFDTPAAAFSSRLSRHSHLDCRARPGGLGLFFERRDSRLVMLVMTGPRRELSIAQSAQLAAQDLFGHRQAVFVEHPLRQIDQSPANDLMNRRGRTGFDHGDERAPLCVIEQASRPRP